MPTTIKLGELGAHWGQVPIKTKTGMVDKLTLLRIEDIHPYLRVELRQIYKEICEKFPANVGARFVQVYRSFAEQDALYAQGRNGDKRQVVTDARGGQSFHNFGDAVDFVLLYDKNRDGQIQTNEVIWDRETDIDDDHMIDWLEVVAVFKKYGWRWGGDRTKGKDYPHFDKSPVDIHELLARYNAGKVITEVRNGVTYKYPI